jgi:uncharacterized protein (DUF58 family)
MSNRRNAIYALLILALLLGLFTGRVLMFTIAYVLGGLMIIAFIFAWTGVTWIRLKRHTRTRRAQVGKRFEESFTIRNTGLLPKLWVVVDDHSTLPGYRASHVVPSLLLRGQYDWDNQAICTRRGEYQLGPVTLVSGDPFGLFRFPRHIGATSRIIVYPATTPIDEFAMPSGLLSGGDAQRRRAHFVTTNAAGVREYAPGDSFNRIHWRSTARKNRLLVKEFELDPLADIWIFLDISAGTLVEKPGVHTYNTNFASPLVDLPLPPSTEEYGVVIAASLARHFLEKGRNLGFVTYGPQREVLYADRSQRQLNQILELLAVVKGTSQFDLEHMLSMNTDYLGRGTTLIVITADQSEGWVREAHILARKGVRIVAVLLDPASFGGTVDTTQTEARLATFNVPTYVVRESDNLTAVLSRAIM